jgi:hypothetical protein
MFTLLKEINSCLVTVVRTVSCVLNVIQDEVTKDLAPVPNPPTLPKE